VWVLVDVVPFREFGLLIDHVRVASCLLERFHGAVREVSHRHEGTQEDDTGEGSTDGESGESGDSSGPDAHDGLGDAFSITAGHAGVPLGCLGFGVLGCGSGADFYLEGVVHAVYGDSGVWRGGLGGGGGGGGSAGVGGSGAAVLGGELSRVVGLSAFLVLVSFTK